MVRVASSRFVLKYVRRIQMSSRYNNFFLKLLTHSFVWELVKLLTWKLCFCVLHAA